MKVNNISFSVAGNTYSQEIANDNSFSFQCILDGMLQDNTTEQTNEIDSLNILLSILNSVFITIVNSNNQGYNLEMRDMGNNTNSIEICDKSLGLSSVGVKGESLGLLGLSNGNIPIKDSQYFILPENFTQLLENFDTVDLIKVQQLLNSNKDIKFMLKDLVNSEISNEYSRDILNKINDTILNSSLIEDLTQRINDYLMKDNLLNYNIPRIVFNRQVNNLSIDSEIEKIKNIINDVETMGANERSIQYNTNNQQNKVTYTDIYLNMQDNKFSLLTNRFFIKVDNIIHQEVLVRNVNDILNVVIEKIGVFKREGITEMKLMLRPKELGEIVVHLRYDGSKLDATLTTNNKVLTNLLNSNIEYLKTQIAMKNQDIQSINIIINNDEKYGIQYDENSSRGNRGGKERKDDRKDDRKNEGIQFEELI